MTPLLPGIVLKPLRFYEAAVTGRANSKRPESSQERWQARGLELQHSHAPSSSQLTNQDIAPHTASQHALLSPMMPKGSGLEQEGRQRGNRRLRRQKCKCKYSIGQASISSKAPFWMMQSSLFRLNCLQLTTPQPSADCFLTNNRSKFFPCVALTLHISTTYMYTILSLSVKRKKLFKIILSLLSLPLGELRGH